jgi:hypothetical protein
MKKTSFALFIAVAGLFSGNLCAAPAQASAKPEAKTEVKAEVKQVADMNGQSNGNQPMMAGGCESLPADQQSFASQLNSANKMTFCSQFSAAQRSNAMQMAGTTGANGMKMTPDMAVEQTAKGMAPMQKNVGGCPVR